MPKVSVIVPIHNPGKYLIPLLNSIIYQTFQDIEIFLIDDGSTDGSREIIKQFEANDSRITAIFRDANQNEHFGQKYSADLGRSLATGEYIMLIDHDDELTLDAIERLYSYTNNGEIDVVQGSYRQIDDHGNITYKPPKFWDEPIIFRDLNSLSEDILLFHLAYAPIALWCCLIKNDFQKQLELHDCIYNDTNFIWELKITANTFCYIPEETYIYKLHDSTSMGTNANKVVYNIFKIFDFLKIFLQEYDISDKLWQIYYVFKFFTLHKVHAGLSPQIKLDYFKQVSKFIKEDPDIAHLIMMHPIDQDFLIHYLLLKHYKEN